jgi:predicted DNA-binding ribbon-helix-helix protein
MDPPSVARRAIGEDRPAMKNSKPTKVRGVAKRSLVLDDHKTSVSLEIEFWTAVKEIAAERDMAVNGLIDRNRRQNNLSSVIRPFVLEYYRSRTTLS